MYMGLWFNSSLGRLIERLLEVTNAIINYKDIAMYNNNYDDGIVLYNKRQLVLPYESDGMILSKHCTRLIFIECISFGHDEAAVDC